LSQCFFFHYSLVASRLNAECHVCLLLCLHTFIGILSSAFLPCLAFQASQWRVREKYVRECVCAGRVFKHLRSKVIAL
jgi:hypothetical protein